jgi:hypothetical protein
VDDKRIEELLKALNSAGQSTNVFKQRLAEAKAAGTGVVKVIEEMESSLREATANARGLNTEFTNIRANLAANLAEIAKTNSAINQGKKAYKGIVSIASQLADEEAGITQYNEKQLKQLNQKAQIRLREVKLAADQLASENGLANLQGAAYDARVKRLELDKRITAEEAALLRAKRDGFSVETRAIELTNQRLQKEKEVTNSIGLTGAALSGVGKILESLGISGLSSEIDDITSKIKNDMRKEIERTRDVTITGGINYENRTASEAKALFETAEKEKLAQEKIIDRLEAKDELTKAELDQLEAAKKARQENVDLQEELVDNHKLVVETQYKELSLASKINHLYKGMAAGLSKGFEKLADPAVIFAFIGKSLLQGNSQAVQLQKNMTISASAARGLRTELAGAAIASGSNFITTDKMIKSYVELTKYVGQSAHILGTEAVKSATYLTEKLHLSGEAAGQLVTMTRLTGRSTEDTFKNMGKVLTKFNMTNKTAFSLKDLMEAVGSASKATVLTLGKSPEGILKAAAAAKKLGLNLDGVEKIADSLLDFESSIENELQAQLLTGNALNLNKAREYAMMGDMENLAKEVGNQEAIKNAFATKNVIAQKAAAQALGMSREELAKMTYQQELNNMGAEQFRAKYGEVAYENAKAQSAQDKFNDLITKSKDILANLLTPLLPIVELVGKLAASPLAAPILAAVVAMKALGGSVGSTIKGVGTLVGKMAKLGQDGVSKSIKDKAVGLKDKVLGKFQAGKQEGLKNVAAGANPMDKGAEATGKMKEKTKGAKDQGPGGFLKSLGQGLASIGKKFGDVVKGALALGIAGVAIGGSFALALKMVEGVDPKTMLAFATSIGIFGGALALVGKQASNAIKGAIAMGIVGVALIPAAYAFKMMAGVDTAQIIGLSGAMIVLGGAAAILGSLSGNIMTGALALGVLGLALVPAAFAFSLLKGVDVGSIVAFSIALPLLALAAAGLGFLAPFIMAGAGALAVLGAAMIPAAIAFNIMAKADLEKIATGLTAIASVGPQLALAGAGMIGLAAGAAVLGIASPMLLFAGAALGMLGIGAQMVANANLEGVASQLTQLGAMGGGLVKAGVGLFAVSAGLTAFAFAMAGASAIGGLTSLFGGGVMGDLQALAAMAEPLATVGLSLTAIAAGLSGIALALSTLETEKINELKGLITTAAFSAPLVAASGAITDIISGITGGSQDKNSNAALEAKLDELISAVRQGGNVYIDGNKAGEALLMASYKSS